MFKVHYIKNVVACHQGNNRTSACFDGQQNILLDYDEPLSGCRRTHLYHVWLCYIIVLDCSFNVVTIL